MKIRTGDLSDVEAVIEMLDARQRWLVEQGRTGQWGTEPFSTRPKEWERVEGWAKGGGLLVAELDGEPVGAIALGQAPEWVPAPTEPELYVRGFVTAQLGRGIGEALLAAARAETVRQNFRVLRLDCWSGGDGALVRYYERAGFTAGERFHVGAWEGQVLSVRL